MTTRACLLVTLVVALTHASPARAGKPRLSVLGLEVINKSGGAVEQSITVAAHDLTQGLRSRVDATGAYAVATTGERELIDEKLMHNCEDERAVCMVEIANDLKADAIMYGSLEKTTDKGKPGYLITVKLFSVAKKSNVQTHSGFVPFPAASSEQELKSWARNAFNRLTGQDSRGTLVIRANVERGTVLIDDVEKDTLKSGQATIPLDEGRYKLAIEAEGYKRWDLGDPLTIRAGQTTSKAADLEKAPKAGPGPGPGPDPGPDISHEVSGSLSHHKTYGGAKALAGVSLALAAGAAGLFAFDYFNAIKPYADKQGLGKQAKANDAMGNPTIDLGHEQCDRAAAARPDIAVAGASTEWRKACAARGRQQIAAIGGGILLAVGIGTVIYVATRSDGVDGSKERMGARRKRPQRQVAFDPVVTPDTAGALVRMSW
ncbi:MAG: hypothetical protein KF773_04525 [Deltaproteobacteria bacterium]|nr:hypothetical protein [Deltaproteobacteria bacterium]